MDSFGIGANNVSNSFGAAVGSSALNLKQAVLIASVCEFLVFSDQPELLILAMVCSLVGSSSWVLFASSRGLPVSTTHGIVGTITGAGIAGFGFGAVKWAGVGNIVLSWLISPLIAGAVTAAIFIFTRWLILQHQNSLKRGSTAIPFYFAVTIAINVFYIIFKGSLGLSLSKLPIGAIIGISLGIALVVFLWCILFLKVYLRRKLEDDEPLKWYHIRAVFTRTTHAPENIEELSSKEKALNDCIETDGLANSDLAALDDAKLPNKFQKLIQKIKNKLFAGLNQNITKNTEAVDDIHSSSTNADVANAPVPAWVLAYCGIAIDIGLLTFGYRVMATLGNNITFMSPSRSFSVSLGTSLTVLTCAKLGLPVSSTHCITGSTTAVGLSSGGGLRSINWKILGLIASSWVFTLPAAGTVSGLLFALIINSPHKV
ncbi:hypothetical protein BGZ82_011742 [Podila clonocystis]|nr:hypothetical protein BGZ82_011742 [Podila clonocystis]